LGLGGNRGNPRHGVSNLPARLHRKVCDPHPVRSATRTRGNTLVWGKVLVAAGSTRELDDQSLAHEVRAICLSKRIVREDRFIANCMYVRKAGRRISGRSCVSQRIRLTRNDVTRIHGVLVLDETKAIHEFDLSDFAGAMGLEVAFDFCLCGIAGKVAQIKACRGYLGHNGSWRRAYPAIVPSLMRRVSACR